MLFFLALAQFLYYSGILLILNASLFYGAGIPPKTTFLAELFVSIALVALPGLLVHACFAYGWAQTAMSARWGQIALLVVSYLPGFYLAALIADRTFFASDPSDFPFPGAANAQLYLIWLACSVTICAVSQIAQARRSSCSIVVDLMVIGIVHRSVVVGGGGSLFAYALP